VYKHKTFKRTNAFEEQSIEAEILKRTKKY